VPVPHQSAGHQLFGFGQRGREITAVVLDESALVPAIKLNRDIAYLVTEGKDRFSRLGKVNQVFTVDFQVEPRWTIWFLRV
jgi:hypothetical protein